MKKLALYWLALGTIVLAACQKETSFELGTSPGTGSLQSDATGDCLPKTISGTYVAGTVLVPTVSTMTVSVNVTKTGTYLITTDTVNGYFFRATGTFTTLGPTNVILRSSGTPFAAGINNFVVSFDGTICDIQVTVLPAGTGPATFTLAGAPAACTTPAINGSYIAGTPLTAANTVVLNVNVTVAGSYNVSTTPAVNGMTFAGTGTLGTGPQTITLTGSGTPSTATSTPIPITVGASTCTFTINVVGGAAGTLDGGGAACAPITVGGTYTVGTALTAANTVQVRIDVTTAGPYSITASSPTAGFSFTKAGTAVVGNDQLITLDPVGGPPTASGLQTFTVTFGSSTCTFTITVAGAAGGALGTLDGGPAACAPVTVGGTYTQGTALTAANTVQVRVDVTTAGTYSITASSPTAGFSFAKTGTAVVGNDQLITLDPVGGPPTASGLQTFTVTFGSSTCTFTITVNAAGGPVVGTLDGGPGACAPITVNGTYHQGAAFNACNSVQVRVDVTVGGTYTISTNNSAGFSFSKSGTIAVGNDQLITLDPVGGPPNAAGTQNFTVTFGASTCTFSVVVQAVGTDYFPRTTNSNWSYEWDDDPLDSLYRTVIAATHSANGNTYNIFMANDGSGLDSSGYYRKNGSDYFEWFDYGSWLGLDDEGWAEYIMLKDNATVGTPWIAGTFTGTASGTPIWVQFRYTVTQKDVPITNVTSLCSITYQNVIVVEEKIWVSLDGITYDDFTDDLDYYGVSYYGRGIGLIKFEEHAEDGSIQAVQKLRRRVVY
jgi:hypothetical protein